MSADREYLKNAKKYRKKALKWSKIKVLKNGKKVYGYSP